MIAIFAIVVLKCDLVSRMTEEIEEIIYESIKLELNIATLYTVFQKAFPDDSAFWSKLAFEEENHASLIKDGRYTFLSEPESAFNLLAPDVMMLKKVNAKLAGLLEKYNKTAPSRETTFNVALYLEESAGEIHYQRAMEWSEAPTMVKMFQLLNTDDKDHADRIRTYMSGKGIKIRSNFVM